MVKFLPSSPPRLKLSGRSADDFGVDLVTAATNFSQANLATKVQYAVAKKLLDSQSEQGAAIVNMIQKADINQANASNDMVVAATGLGGSVDVTA